MTIAKSDETATSPALIEEDFEDFWEPTPPPTDLIFDDGEPLESNRHRIAMNVLDSLPTAGLRRTRRLLHRWQYVYLFQPRTGEKLRFSLADFFAVLNVDGRRERQGWVIWEEEGRYPDVIVELTSPSTARTDKVRKKAIYEGTFRTPDYFIYDPFDGNSLQGWHLGADQRYHSLERNERGWLWCETLGYWLGTWQGTIDRETAIWARFYDPEGNLIPLPEEAAQEQHRTEQAAAAQEQAARHESKRLPHRSS
jgi:hypothetical protein